MSIPVRWILPTLAFTMLMSVIFLSSSDFHTIYFPVQTPITLPEVVPGFLVHTAGCKIPYMNPFDPGIQKYIEKVKDVECSVWGPLVESNATAIWVNDEVAAKSNFSDDGLFCCYRPLWRNKMKVKKKKANADSSIK